MDGYAFCYAEAAANQFTLPLSQRIAAGTAPEPLAANTVARIFTGAEIPAGADTVAMQENCIENNGIVKLDAGCKSAGQCQASRSGYSSGADYFDCGH